MPLNYVDHPNNVWYNWKIDWGIGYSPLSTMKESSCTSYLAIVKAKVAGGVGLATPQLPGYLGCL